MLHPIGDKEKTSDTLSRNRRRVSVVVSWTGLEPAWSSPIDPKIDSAKSTIPCIIRKKDSVYDGIKGGKNPP